MLATQSPLRSASWDLLGSREASIGFSGGLGSWRNWAGGTWALASLEVRG